MWHKLKNGRCFAWLKRELLLKKNFTKTSFQKVPPLFTYNNYGKPFKAHMPQICSNLYPNVKKYPGRLRAYVLRCSGSWYDIDKFFTEPTQNWTRSAIVSSVRGMHSGQLAVHIYLRSRVKIRAGSRIHWTKPKTSIIQQQRQQQQR